MSGDSKELIRECVTMSGCCCCMPLLHNHLMDSCSYVRKNTLLAAKGGCICTPLTPPESATGQGGSVHCARYEGALPIGFWLAFWCAFIGNANHTRTVFAFCFVLVSCKRQAGKIERLYWCLVQQKTLQTLQGSAINKIPNIPQCTLLPRPMCQTLLSDFQGSGSETKHYVGVASLSIFGGNFVLAKVRLGLISVRCSELRGVRSSEVRNVLVLW